MEKCLLLVANLWTLCGGAIMLCTALLMPLLDSCSDSQGEKVCATATFILSEHFIFLVVGPPLMLVFHPLC